MSRKKSEKPKLLQWKGKGPYYFRRLINGKNTVISTKTSEKKKAEEFRDAYIKSENAASLPSIQEKDKFQLMNILAKSVTGANMKRMPLEEAYDFWLKHSPGVTDNGKKYQEQIQKCFQQFMSWCAEEGISNIEDVDQSVAILYQAYIHSEKHYTGKTSNEHLKLLSRIFRKIDMLRGLPHRNPFSREIVTPSKEPKVSEATHLPLESDMIDAVMKTAALYGQDWLDLFTVALQTGMRLKDAALFSWNMIKDGFIEFEPEKTIRYGSKARLPVSPLLKVLLERRKKENGFSIYVNPAIAGFYQSSDWVTKHSKEIFELALRKENTQLSKEGRQRQRNGCIRSFHSFRVTFMSLLAAKQVPLRDAMTMLGWESIEMVQLYSKMLEQARGDMDRRNKELLDNLRELQIELPEVVKVPEPLRPTKEALEKLVSLYSNRTIGIIYDISDVAVKNWMVKFGITRARRIIDNGLDENVLQKIREGLRTAA